jgi:hypothetical protein
VPKKETFFRLEPFLRAFALTGGLVVFLLFRPRSRPSAKNGST